MTAWDSVFVNWSFRQNLSLEGQGAFVLLPFFGAGRRVRHHIPVPHRGAGQSLRSPAPSRPRLRRKLPTELLKLPNPPGACGGGRQLQARRAASAGSSSCTRVGCAAARSSPGACFSKGAGSVSATRLGERQIQLSRRVSPCPLFN